MLETFQSIFGSRLNAVQVEQAQFPLSAGGVGLLARSGALAAAAYVGSWALVYHRVAAATGWSLPAEPSGILPGIIARTLYGASLTTQAAGATSASHLLDPSWWEAARTKQVAHVQRALAKEVRAHQRECWLQRVPRRAAANLHSHSGWGAGSALLRCPTELALRLDDSCVCNAFWERLGVGLTNDARCPRRFRCGRVCRQRRRFGAHAHCCPGLAGVRTRYRHNSLAEEWCGFLRAAGRFVELEQRDPALGLAQEHVWILLNMQAWKAALRRTM